VLVDDRMWATFTQDLRELLPDAEFGLASTVLEPLRIRKDEVELAALRRAGELADRVSLEIRERGDELLGMTEAELAAEIDRLLAVDGGEEPAFETIVASGPNGPRPHHHGGSREIESGDPVVLDFGAFVAADLEAGTGLYPGDQTRTIVVGEPPGSTSASMTPSGKHSEPRSTPSSQGSPPGRSTAPPDQLSRTPATATPSSIGPATGRPRGARTALHRGGQRP